MYRNGFEGDANLHNITHAEPVVLRILETWELCLPYLLLYGAFNVQDHPADVFLSISNLMTYFGLEIRQDLDVNKYVHFDPERRTTRAPPAYLDSVT